MQKPRQDSAVRMARSARRRAFIKLSALTASSIFVVGSASAQTDSENESEDAAETDPTPTPDSDEEQTPDSTQSDEPVEGCTGAPRMSRTSITTPNSRITTESPAVVEANFRPDPTIPADCTIIVDLEFSFTDAGFQWGGGADWDQSTSDLLVGTFEVNPGEVRDIRGELYTQGAEAGDRVTVVADYELWYEGDIENSVQQSGIRHTIQVEAPKTPESEGNVTGFEAPGFGIPAALAGVGGGIYALWRNVRTGDSDD